MIGYINKITKKYVYAIFDDLEVAYDRDFFKNEYLEDNFLVEASPPEYTDVKLKKDKWTKEDLTEIKKTMRTIKW